MAEPKKLFANHKFSLTDKQHAEWQSFLRSLPDNVQKHPAWLMLHDLSYTTSYTEQPEYPLWKASEKSK